MFKKIQVVCALLLHFFLVSAVHAELAVGAQAPDFITDAALGGKAFSFHLAETLKKGPVVLYFYPKAFTSGCTVEAHLFAEATPEFTSLGATVLGMSNDDIETLKKFSVEECRNAFAVGSDSDGKIIKAYDAKMIFGSSVSKRVSYVITPDNKVLYVYSAMGPKEHVKNTLDAVKGWKKMTP